MTKKKSLVFLHFIWSKNLKKLSNENLSRGRESGNILADKFC